MNPIPQTYITPSFFKTVLLIISLALFGCKKANVIPIVIKEDQNVSKFDLDTIPKFARLKFTNNRFSGPTQLSKNSEEEHGTYAMFNDGEQSQYKIGPWKTYYKNGQLKEEGRYLIGRYVQCCFTGHCMRYYNYKVGKWHFYYEDGTLELEGHYSIKKLGIDTNCGGDYIKYGILDANSKFYDRSGQRIKAQIDSLKLNYEIEYTHTYPGMYLIPLKDNDTIISVAFDH